MRFFERRNERRRASKWHQDVDRIAAGDLRPAPTALSGGQFHVFPYTRLHTITKEYLGKRKRSQQEQEKVLVELIRSHSCKEIAFAACAEHLSTETADYLLVTSFPVDTETLNGLEAYLHALVAAAHSQEQMISRNDATFAVSIVAVTRNVIHNRVHPCTVEALFLAWNNGTPSNQILLSRAKVLVRKVCQRVESDLNAFKAQLSLGWLSELSYNRAIQYKEIFSLLRVASIDLEDCLGSFSSSWRGWADWSPNKVRLQKWENRVSAASDQFGCLIELEGPDLASPANPCIAQWQALVRRKELLPWLEAKGFKLGAGLITGDSEQLLTTFVKALLDCIAGPFSQGDPRLLHLLIGKGGLDLSTIRAWQAAVSLLQPQFIDLLVSRNTPSPVNVVDIVIQGLNALANDVTQSVRRPLRQEVGHCVQVALTEILGVFQISFRLDDEWIAHARRLWELRKTIAAAGWIHPSADSCIVNVSQAQASSQSLTSLYDLHSTLKDGSTGVSLDLQATLDAYVQLFVVEGIGSEDETTVLPHLLHNVWLYTQRETTREAVLLIAAMELLDIEYRLACIKKLQSLPETTAYRLQECLTKFQQGERSLWRTELLELTQIVTYIDSDSGHDACWQELVVCLIRTYDIRIDQPEFTAAGISTYRQLVQKLNDVVGSRMDRLSLIHTWLSKLSSVSSTIQTLQDVPESGPGIHSILTAHAAREGDHVLKMLQCLRCEYHQADDSRIGFMQELALALRAGNSRPVSRAVLSIAKLDAVGFDQCKKLLAVCHESRTVASMRLSIWLRMSVFPTATQSALSNLGEVLDLKPDNKINRSNTAFESVRKDYAKQVALLIARAQQIEQSRFALTRQNPVGVKRVVSTLGLEQPTGVAGLMADLPRELVSVVEETAANQVEFRFSASEFSPMERLAYSLKGTETLSVHLRLHDSGKFDGLCVHLHESGEQASTPNHTYFQSNFSPDHLYCRGKLTRLTYVVARGLHRAAQQQGETSLKVLYAGVQALIHASAMRCMVCSESIGAQLHRATICNSSACQTAYRKADLDMRLQDVRTNGRVVDLLLTSVFAASAINNLNLLPARPLQLNDAAKLQVLLNSLPTTPQLAAAPNFRTGLLGCGQRAELLLSWLCNSYRGFIISATGAYRLPNLPNFHQFLVVDGPPEVEAAFAQHNHLKTRHALFHGTSMDRLYPVLAQGLKVLSGTPLMKHGAYGGNGIYLAREPSTAMSYATCAQRTSNNYNAFFNSRSDFKDATVLLGCEHAGDDTLGRGRDSGVHVIQDQTRVMVRYILIAVPNARAPRAQDIRDNMLSTFDSLRKTAVRGSSGHEFDFAGPSRCSVM